MNLNSKIIPLPKNKRLLIFNRPPLLLRLQAWCNCWRLSQAMFMMILLLIMAGYIAYLNWRLLEAREMNNRNYIIVDGKRLFFKQDGTLNWNTNK